MGAPKTRSILYRLIDAGRLARKALLVPLLERGLEPGDDAVLFMLRSGSGIAQADLCSALGLEPTVLERCLKRLIAHDLIDRRASGPDLVPALVLTRRGARIRALLAERWAALEAALLVNLDRKQRKALRKVLGRFVEALRH
jgi:DNA-binding MarR family transcriptional regulator